MSADRTRGEYGAGMGKVVNPLRRDVRACWAIRRGDVLERQTLGHPERQLGLGILLDVPFIPTLEEPDAADVECERAR